MVIRPAVLEMLLSPPRLAESIDGNGAEDYRRLPLPSYTLYRGLYQLPLPSYSAGGRMFTASGGEGCRSVRAAACKLGGVPDTPVYCLQEKALFAERKLSANEPRARAADFSLS